MIPVNDGVRIKIIFVGVAASLRLKEGVGRGVLSVRNQGHSHRNPVIWTY